LPVFALTASSLDRFVSFGFFMSKPRTLSP